MADRAGELAFGRYRLLQLLGRGGMGEVYLAHDETLNRRVAIKYVTPDRADHPDARRRLLREAQTAAGLDHPNICTVYETGEAPDGRAFIVMQYVEGESLAHLLRRGPMPVREALLLGQQVAEALAAAHARGVVHRDLKPGNVIVSASGRPKLVDFGLAKRVTLPAGVTDSPTLSGATDSGGVVGTAAYMSPEQVQERPVDRRSDLFSFGVLLFECLTGRRGFEAPTPFETAANIVHRALPAASSLRPELTDGHDELCWRLTAKAPADRFQSADEVVGALRVLLGEASGRSSWPSLTEGPRPFGARFRRRWRTLALAAAIGLLIVVAVGRPGLFGRWSGTLPLPPPEADRWYRDGVGAIREGSYMRARRNLERAVAIFPEHALAHVRLAEANAELDDQHGAQQDLLRVSALVPNEARLPAVERLRLAGVRALVLRDVDRAVSIYRELAERQPDDAGAWLDLGRVQEAAGLRADARASYRRALGQDPQFAAAYLRLAYVEGLEFRREEALEAFARAERLYHAASDVEGETEVLLRRGIMHDAFLDLTNARADLERAQALAAASRVEYQQLRARLALSSVTAAEGHFVDAEATALAAVDDALASGLDAIAADGLIGLAFTLLQAGRSTEAEEHLLRAITLAEARGAGRTAARARVQLAGVYENRGDAKQALSIVEALLPSLRDGRHRRFEFAALLIAARVHEREDRLEQARQDSRSLLALAEQLRDDGQIAAAASNLATVTTALGAHPDALPLRERAEAIARQQGHAATLPYYLANRAELLIVLGRREEAEAPLRELEAGIAAGAHAYTGRQPHVAYLRTLAAATALRCAEATRHSTGVPPAAAPGDELGAVASAIAAFCAAQRGRPPGALLGQAGQPSPAAARELHYWLGAAALARDDHATALDHASRGLAELGERVQPELRWRLTQLGAAAAQGPGRATAHERMAVLARQADEDLRSAWGPAYGTFSTRPDLVWLSDRAQPVG